MAKVALTVIGVRGLVAVFVKAGTVMPPLWVVTELVVLVEMALAVVMVKTFYQRMATVVAVVIRAVIGLVRRGRWCCQCCRWG